jgi:cell fate regulator YaaT (PSP1 superfamily)
VSIFPLPVFEADRDPTHRSEMTDAEAYARLKPPTSIVVRVGRMRFVAEYGYRGDSKPGCGSKLVARTHRGTEVVEMLTTTCGNSGCSKSISRQEMLEYVEGSGGRDYPFHTDGQILRVATIDDLNRWSEVQTHAAARVAEVKRIVAASGLPMKVVDVEPILGQELLTIYFLSEDRVDFRELVRQLATEFHTRIEMRQVGARDEARLVADYERCGQHCCCKNFLKVLKPISMRSAKVQKATLDPLKISGRCGRLMCCLRYEDQTYEDLKQRLPRNKSRVGTSEGPGIVMDSKILVQLVLVQLEHDGREIAVPVEELMDPETCPRPAEGPGGGGQSTAPTGDPLRGLSSGEVRRKVAERDRRDQGADQAKPQGKAPRQTQQDQFRERSKDEESGSATPEGSEMRTRPPQDAGSPTAEDASAGTSERASEGASGGGSARRERKRRRRRRGGEEPTGGSKEGDDAGDGLGGRASDGLGFTAEGGAEEIEGKAGGEVLDGDERNSNDGAGPEQSGTGRSRRRRRRRRPGGGGPGSAGRGTPGPPSE